MSVVGPVLWWHVEQIRTREKNGEQQHWSFSPVGIGPNPHSWVLMRWERTIRDGTRKQRILESWDSEMGGKKPPQMPPKLRDAFLKRVKNMKSKPWPGSD